MSDKVPMSIRIAGYWKKDRKDRPTDFYVLAKGNQDYVVATCDIFNTAGEKITTQKTWLDAPVSMLAIGQEYSVQMEVYQPDDPTWSPCYTAEQLIPTGGDASQMLPSIMATGGAPAPAARATPPRAAPPQKSPLPSVNTGAGARATPPAVVNPADGREAVLIMHRQAWHEAGEIVSPEGCIEGLEAPRIRAQDQMARSIITGWVTNANLYVQALARAKFNREKAAKAKAEAAKKAQGQGSQDGFGSDNADMPIRTEYPGDPGPDEVAEFDPDVDDNIPF